MTEEVRIVGLLPPPTIEQRSYAEIKYDSAGYVVTENAMKDPGGLFRTKSGIWEVSTFTARRLEHNDITPVLMVKHGKKDMPMWDVDPGSESWSNSTTYSYKTINECVFNAVEAYLNITGLGGLTNGDKSWFRKHKSVSEQGVSHGAAIPVIHGLVAPYGLGVSRIFLPKSSNVPDATKKFMSALGTNPVGAKDHKTDNNQFIEQNNLDADLARQIKEICRFEFVDEPPPMSIVMTNASIVQKTANVGGAWSSTTAGVGHADVIGARDHAGGNWLLACQLGRGVKYATHEEWINSLSSDDNLSSGESSAKKETKYLNAWMCKVGGKLVSQLSSPPVQSQYAQQAQYNWANVVPKQPSIKPEKKKTELEEYDVVRLVSKCSVCGEGTLFNASGYVFCDGKYCNYSEYVGGNFLEVEVGQTSSDDAPVDAPVIARWDCPFCISTLKDGVCPNCGFSEEVFTEALDKVCEKHPQGTVYEYWRSLPGAKESQLCHVCFDCAWHIGLQKPNTLIMTSVFSSALGEIRQG